MGYFVAGFVGTLGILIFLDSREKPVRVAR